MKLDGHDPEAHRSGAEEVHARNGQDGQILMQTFEAHYLDRLKEMGCSEVMDKIRAALVTVGPRPFGQDKPDDWPYWFPLDKLTGAHWLKCGWRMKAAQVPGVG